MKESKVSEPAWITRARAAWESKSEPPPEKRWTAYWIKKFLVYLERRNTGKLPAECPSFGVVGSFCRFIEEKWEVEVWQLEQARAALQWLGTACGFSGGAGESGEVRSRVDMGGTVERKVGSELRSIWDRGSWIWDR